MRSYARPFFLALDRLMAVTPNDPLPVAPEVVTGFFRAAVCRANHPRFFGFYVTITVG